MRDPVITKTCPACGIRYRDSIPGYPNESGLCDDCASKADAARWRALYIAIDRDGRCGHCGADIIGSVRAHEETCRFRDSPMEIRERLARLGIQ